MAWSDNITVCELSDEPSLSDELNSIISSLASEDDASDRVHVVLNFGEVSYVNSSNISQLMHLRRVQATHERKLVLCSLREDVAQVLRVTGVDRLFSIAPDPLTALTALQLEPDPSSGSSVG
jgi:anti-anti-sigma factor